MESSTVLIVDDVAKNIQVAANFLKDENYKLMFATSGESAIKSVGEKDIDLILLDVMMPGLDGFETCKKIKTTKKGKDLPIIFLTAKSDEESIKNGFAVGGCDYITKPFHKEELVARVRNHLDLYFLRKNLESRVEEEIVKRKQGEEILIQNSKMASMGSMISAITHQWKQPLNTISVIIQELGLSNQEGILDKESIDECVEIIVQKIKFMSETVDDFRNFFKDDKNYQNFLVHREITAISSMLTPIFNRNSIKVIFEGDETIDAYGIVNEFKQVVLNILNNAIDKFDETKPEKREIIISATKDSSSVDITFSDTGGGIPQESLDKIFNEKFTTKPTGSGIGLYMCKVIIEDHLKGSLSAFNTKDGASFYIKLPISKEVC